MYGIIDILYLTNTIQRISALQKMNLAGSYLLLHSALHCGKLRTMSETAPPGCSEKLPAERQEGYMQVLYKSTRGKGEAVTASMAILKGLSEDGGLVCSHIYSQAGCSS